MKPTQTEKGMKRIYARMLWVGVLCLLLAASGRAQEKRLFIFQTSDTHSRIDPIEATSADSCAGMGGAVRRATLLKQYRSEHPEMLLFDCGDICQGSLYSLLFQGEVEIRLMNLMKYDAMTLGNHEFDYGMENLARILRLAEFPIVCTNYEVTGTPLEGILKPYTVLERDGLRIGVVGIGPKLEGLVQAENYQGVVYHEPEGVVQEAVNRLREKERCDVVVCLSHIGLFNDSERGDEKLIARTHGIDLVLGGHTHTFIKKPLRLLNAEGDAVPLMHIGNNGAYVGEIQCILSKK